MRTKKLKLDLHKITKCEACGAKDINGLVACSLFGGYSGAWCENCLSEGRDSYNLMVDYIANAGMWPDDINETFQTEVRRQLKLHNKTEEEFKRDLDKMLEDFMNEPMSTYVIFDTLGEEF
jgi:hypothetical protein